MFSFCGLTTTHYYVGCCEPSNWCSIGHLFLWETIEGSKILKTSTPFQIEIWIYIVWLWILAYIQYSIIFNVYTIHSFRFVKHILFWYEICKMTFDIWLLWYHKTFLISLSRYYCFFTPTTLGKPITQCIHNLYRSWETK